jgi:hypothetical protein
MLTKTQLQQEVQNLESKLQKFREQLNSHKEVTIETAGVGDTLEDGSIVLKKENGLALLVSSAITEVTSTWSKEFPKVFEALNSQGFNPSQWFVPTVEQLELAYKIIPGEFPSTFYWSSTEGDSRIACCVDFLTGTTDDFYKTFIACVRSFRCVTY